MDLKLWHCVAIMAVIIGLRTNGSRAPGKLFGTSFAVYSNRYGYTYGYNYVRRFLPSTYPVLRYYRERAREFGVATSEWKRLTDAQRAEYEYNNLMPLASPMERYISDYTWLWKDPFTCTTPIWQGTIAATAKTDYISIHWEILLADWEPHQHRLQLWLWKDENATGTMQNPYILQRLILDPTYSAGKFRFYMRKDFNYTPGLKSVYKAILTSGQNMRSAYSNIISLDNPTNPPGGPPEEEMKGGGLAHPIRYIKLYIADQSNHRIQKRSRPDLSFVSKIGSLGTGNDQFNAPYGIACDEKYIYIADAGLHRIQKRLKSDLSFVSQIGTQGNGDDQFDYPYGIACDETHLYICDGVNNRIQKRLKSDLSFVNKIGSPGTGDDQFNRPHGIACDEKYIYIADTNNDRIQKRLKSNLSLVQKTGTHGSGEGEYNAPRGIHCDKRMLYIADTMNHRIQRLRKSDLLFWDETGSLGNQNDQFDHPQDISCDEKYLYVVDRENHRIVKYLKETYAYDSKIGTQGAGDDQFDFPAGICSNFDREVYTWLK